MKVGHCGLAFLLDRVVELAGGRAGGKDGDRVAQIGEELLPLGTGRVALAERLVHEIELCVGVDDDREVTRPDRSWR